MPACLPAQFRFIIWGHHQNKRRSREKRQKLRVGQLSLVNFEFGGSVTSSANNARGADKSSLFLSLSLLMSPFVFHSSFALSAFQFSSLPLFDNRRTEKKYDIKKKKKRDDDK